MPNMFNELQTYLAFSSKKIKKFEFRATRLQLHQILLLVFPLWFLHIPQAQLV